MPLSTVIVGDSLPGETAPRRKYNLKAGAASIPKGLTSTTIPQFLTQCVARNGNNNALAYRELIEIHTDKKQIKKIIDGQETTVSKEWQFYEQSPYKYITYPQLLSNVKKYALGLNFIGLLSGVKFHIFASTSHKWLQTFLATQFISLTIVTAYDTLGESGLIHSLLQTDSIAIFTDNQLLPNLVGALINSKNSIKFIIHSEPINSSDKRDNGKFFSLANDARLKILENRPDIKFYSMDEIISFGNDIWKLAEKEGRSIEPEPAAPAAAGAAAGSASKAVSGASGADSGAAGADSASKAAAGASGADSASKAAAGASGADSASKAVSGAAGADSASKVVSGAAGADSASKAVSGASGADSASKAAAGASGADSASKAASGAADSSSASKAASGAADSSSAASSSSSIRLKYPKTNDLCCIMYTSGSTGDPKGVEITHENIIAGLAGVSTNVGRDTVKPHDRVVCFLPLAHILEMVFELTAIWWGSTLGYANVKTLTDASVRNSKADLAEFKPTLMVGVAAVWESVRKGVLAKVKSQPNFNQKIFRAAFSAKKNLNSIHLPGSIFDFVFKKVKEATGGQLKLVMNGGSPISKDAQIFISNLIAPMLIGYGLTETCANTTLMCADSVNYDTAGTLVGSITVKLLDVPDAGYFAKNNQGEVVIKGKCVTRGYYKNEEETKKAFTKDGWFRTGDIGEWASNGDLKVIDRLKNLVKTLNGEYIAIEKLEARYRSNPYVLNLCVYADANNVKPIAFVLPNEGPFKNFLVEEKLYSQSEIKSKDISDLVNEPKVVKALLKSINESGKSQGLNGIEILQNIVLLDEEWTPQNGYVTSAQKLQRKKILNDHKDAVEKAYS